jgi:hypothetical protein
LNEETFLGAIGGEGDVAVDHDPELLHSYLLLFRILRLERVNIRNLNRS